MDVSPISSEKPQKKEREREREREGQSGELARNTQAEVASRGAPGSAAVGEGKRGGFWIRRLLIIGARGSTVRAWARRVDLRSYKTWHGGSGT